MKRRKEPLRTKALSTDALQKVQGGRGIVHGYIECNACGATIPPGADACPNCFTPINQDIPEVPPWYLWG